ncbi:Got1/Sft2-like family protein [Saccharomyces cerevisiae]|nr:Got1/Sft2-like family protein [Saccharomyces cerevisiae]
MSEEPPSDQVNSLRDSLNRWNQTRQQNSQGLGARPGAVVVPIVKNGKNGTFCLFLLGATACFTLCTFLFPVLAAKPRKFGLLWTMGSLLFVLAFGVLMGPLAYLKHLTARERLPFSMFFFATCFMTIYFAAFSKNTVLTITCALLELVAVIYYAISYFPFGATGLRMLSSAGVNSARGVLRI